MKLVLYSGDGGEENKTLDQMLLAMVPKNPQITFIPSCSLDSDVCFRRFVRRFEKLRVDRFIKLSVDMPLEPVLLQRALESQIIYLDGGNTFYFLKHLREKKMLPRLKEFFKNGGVLSGASAGAILLTPSIATASFPHFDRDDNDDKIEDLSAMGLVDFEFFPHFTNSKRYHRAMLDHSKKIARPLFCCPDGSGIVVCNGVTSFVGKYYGFLAGASFRI